MTKKIKEVKEVTEPTEEEKKAFIKRYEALCEELGMQVQAQTQTMLIVQARPKNDEIKPA